MTAVRKVTAVWARQIADLLEARGHPAELILREVGLKRAEVKPPDARIAVTKHVALIEAAAEHLNDPCFGLHFGAGLDPLDAGAIGFLAANSPTLGDALKNFAKYLATMSEGSRAHLDLKGEQAHWTMGLTDRKAVADRQFYEYLLAASLNICRFAVSRRITPTTVEFQHPRSSGLDEFRRYFGAPVRFGAMRNMMTLEKSQLSLPCRSADQRLFRIVKAHCDELLAKSRKAKNLQEEVTHLVGSLLPTGTATKAHVASSLNMSERTLSRRLAEQGMSFRQIIDEERRRMAFRYLDDPAVRPTQVAYLLGYSEPSAFTHAFRRWTQQSPAEYRGQNNDVMPPAH